MIQFNHKYWNILRNLTFLLPLPPLHLPILSPPPSRLLLLSLLFPRSRPLSPPPPLPPLLILFLILIVLLFYLFLIFFSSFFKKMNFGIFWGFGENDLIGVVKVSKKVYIGELSPYKLTSLNNHLIRNFPFSPHLGNMAPGTT